MPVEVFGRTERGYVRPKNEDNLLLCPDRGLYFVADGLGGHPGGEVASRLAIQWTAEWLASIDAAWSDEEVRFVLEQVNRQLTAYGVTNPKLKGLGTTLTGVYLEGNHRAWMIHAGDSRLYGYGSNSGCEQISTDQTLSMEAVQRGVLPMEEAAAHPYWHVLTSCLGSGSFAPQIFHFTDPYATFLLCTDGLYNAVTFSEIQSMMGLKYREPGALVNDLVDLALKRGGKDNITVIGIYINQD